MNVLLAVAIALRRAVDETWRPTQSPGLHEPWDLRFTSIEYQPRAFATHPQQFLYATRIGFGLALRRGESTDDRSTPGCVRTLALRFLSDDPVSLIGEGSGYWRYKPLVYCLQFGKLVDRVAFARFIDGHSHARKTGAPFARIRRIGCDPCAPCRSAQAAAISSAICLNSI